MRRLALAICAMLAVLVVRPALAAPAVRLKHATISAALRAPAVPGKTDWIAIHLEMMPGWHSYWRNPGETGLPTRIAWSLPRGVTAGAIHWPVPQRFQSGNIVDFGYAGAVTLLVPLTVAHGAATGPATAHVSWLLCAQMCIPQSAALTIPLDRASGDAGLFAPAFAALPKPFAGSARYAMEKGAVVLTLSAPSLSLTTQPVQFFPATARAVAYDSAAQIRRVGDSLNIRLRRARHGKPFQVFAGVLALGPGQAFAVRATQTATPPAVPPAQAPVAAPIAAGMIGALLFAFLGGLILNLMPCVLPILSMKALALIQSGERAAQMRRDGLFYAGGVLASFLLMAGALLAFKSAGAAIGWGFQLQSPVLVLLLWLLVMAIGLNLLGVFEVPAGLSGLGGHLTGRETAGSAFVTGVLAVLVASPCTAPFMGAALGYALTQPPLAALSVFLALGLGFAAPLTAFTFLPGVARLIPRPGPWMLRVRELLAFPMLATAIWLLWVLDRQTGATGLLWALGIGLGVVFALWLLRATSVLALRWGIGALGSAALIAAVIGLQPAAVAASPSSGAWRPWSAQAVAAARAAGHPVLVDFSAAWCVTCLVNERVALDNPSVERSLKQARVVTLKGDWTSRDPAITAVLARYGRAGVPLYLLYPASASAGPIVLPQLLTPGQVLHALASLGGA